MELDYYRKGRNYELFIRKSFKCEKGKRYGADESLMLKLYLNESQKKDSRQRIPAYRDFFKVKLYLEKALIILTKRKKYVESHEHFSPILLELANASTANELMKIVNAGLSKMIKIENEMKRIK